MSREIVTRNIVHGELEGFGTRPGVVMGERLRQALNVRAGDKVTLVTHKLNENGTIAPRYTDYDLLASFLTRRYEFDGALVFVPLPMLQDDLEYGDQAVSSIDLDIADPAAAPRMAAELRKALGPRRPQGRRLARPQCPLRGRPAGRAGDDVHHPHPDRGGGGDERGGELHHAGPRQARQHRHPAHHGRVAAHHRARLLHVGRRRRAGGHRRRHRARPAGLRQHAVDRGAAVVDDGCGGQRLGRGRFHHVHAGSGAGGRGGDRSLSWRIVLSLAAAAYPAWRSTRVEPVEGLRHE